MRSLRARIVALLILAIVTVVGLATFAASRALQPPVAGERTHPVVRQLQLLVSLAERDRPAAVAAGLVLRDTPASGVQDAVMSDLLSKALGGRTVVVARNDGSPSMTASVDIGNKSWLLAEIPDNRPPPGGWMVLAGWIVLIVLGSTAVSIFAASKIIRPLQLLESAVGRIGADGVLAHVPETGPGEVRATAQALNRLSARLQTAMESRMRLVAAAGHDLRTPMTRMRLRAEFIADDAERGKWLADLEELDAIADSAIRLVREEASMEEAEPVRLDGMIRDIANELGQLDLAVTLSTLAPLTVAAAPLALKRALRNLAINAATYGRGGTITLRREDRNAVLAILDEGPGIPDHLMGQVYEPFFRVDAARRKTSSGAGLGLAIAKEIVERFGGTIDIANRKPSGLAQTVTLPLLIEISEA
ncbi:ATP-binding protein [Shinella sp.]|uniref:ATP-binding protein n=1 Tax=Shinella sp. TaxID=1870904 RepID=UPI0039E579DE